MACEGAEVLCILQSLLLDLLPVPDPTHTAHRALGTVVPQCSSAAAELNCQVIAGCLCTVMSWAVDVTCYGCSSDTLHASQLCSNPEVEGQAGAGVWKGVSSSSWKGCTHPSLWMPMLGTAAVLGSGAQADPVGFCCERGAFQCFLGAVWRPRGGVGNGVSPACGLSPRRRLLLSHHVMASPGSRWPALIRDPGRHLHSGRGPGGLGLLWGAEGILGANGIPTRTSEGRRCCVLQMGPTGPVKSITGGGLGRWDLAAACGAVL